MSDYIARPSHDEEANSSQALQPSWMSHWMKRSLKPTSLVNNSSMIGYKNGDINGKSFYEESALKIEDGFLKLGKRSGKEVEEIETGIISESPMKKTRDTTGYPPILALKLGQGAKNTSSMKAQMEHEYGDNAISLALSLGQGEKNKISSIEKRAIPHSHKEVGSTSHTDASGPLVLSNDNFTCLGEGRCKYQKFSTFLFHEKTTNNEPSLELSQSDGLEMQTDSTSKKNNFLPFILRNQSENGGGQNSVDPRTFGHGWQSGDKVPCSVRNVETMRICTMVKSVENSLGGPPKISERAHHFLFTKETCVNMSEAHQEYGRQPYFCSEHNEENTFGSSRPPQGVKIQPLWTSTDSEEKENTGNPSIGIAESGNESSDETEATHLEAPENQHAMLGKELCPSQKDDAVNKNATGPGLNSNLEKSRSKRPIISDIPDMNEAVEGGVSSSDDTEPSTSRVHSLNAKQLFPCGEQTSVSSELSFQKGRLDSNSRWIKRLKTSHDSFGVGIKSSELGEASSNKKRSQFFNRIMKNNTASKGQMVLGENVKSVEENEERKTQNMALESSWIRRWCRNYPTPLATKPEPLMVCEPNSLKLGQDELSKKQFPSIAAMALMGKAMNGFRPCEFRKKGSIVVWNTDEY